MSEARPDVMLTRCVLERDHCRLKATTGLLSASYAYQIPASLTVKLRLCITGMYIHRCTHLPRKASSNLEFSTCCRCHDVATIGSSSSSLSADSADVDTDLFGRMDIDDSAPASQVLLSLDPDVRRTYAHTSKPRRAFCFSQ